MWVGKGRIGDPDRLDMREEGRQYIEIGVRKWDLVEMSPAAFVRAVFVHGLWVDLRASISAGLWLA